MTNQEKYMGKREGNKGRGALVRARVDHGLEGTPHSRERREPRPSRHAQAEGLTAFQRSGRASFGVDFEPCFSPEVRYARGNR